MKLEMEHEKEKSGKGRRIGRFFARFGILLLALLLVLLLFCYGVLWVLCKGPSETARDIFVMSCMETSFARYFPPLVLSEEEIADIQLRNTVVATDEVTKTDADFTQPKDDPDDGGEIQPDLEIVDVFGSTFKGKMMIVKDPSRIVVGTPPFYGEGAEGVKLANMIADAGAVAGINGGGFVDEGGVGNGGTPLGYVIKGGKLLYGSPETKGTILGFDQKNVFHVGSMTAQEALNIGIRDAVTFYPALVINGKPADIAGTGGGLNPRTAIGQRADGSVLLLVIEGRQPNSMGANYKDLVDVMLEYGAINAGNLDGGSSSTLYYNGELLTTCSSLYGPRKIPNGFLVLP